MIFGKGHENLNHVSFTLLVRKLEIVDTWKYLGVTVISDKLFMCTCKDELTTFYRSVNSVLNIQVGRPNDEIMMRILYSVCVPTLLYACEVKDMCSGDMTKINSAVNNAIRKIFGFSYWQGVREMRQLFNCESVTVIFAKRRSNFLKSLPSMSNAFIRELLKRIDAI